jgi:hypothetical protein
MQEIVRATDLGRTIASGGARLVLLPSVIVGARAG